LEILVVFAIMVTTAFVPRPPHALRRPISQSSR